MEGPGGLLHDPDVEKLLAQFILFEIFTDRLPEEAEYAALQKELTGYNANPTYIVFDSEDHLEVSREAYTNSKRQFVEFLEKGLTDEPAFQSQVRFAGLEITEGGEEVTVLRPAGPLISDAGTEARYLGDEVYAYRSIFGGRQEFVVGEEGVSGEYAITVQLVTGLYEGDERLATLSLPSRLRFEVVTEH